MRTLEDLELKQNEKSAIREAKRILKEQFPVEEVILFGSKARGGGDEESDIDLLILTTQPLHWKERHALIETLFEIEIKYDVVISIVVNTVYDWQEGVCTVLPLHNQIDMEGVEIP